MDNLGDFFSLIGEEKKKDKEKTKEILGEVSLGDLFSSLSEEKKKVKEKNLKKEKELDKIKRDAKIFEAFLFNEPPKVEQSAIKAVKVLETELVNLKSTSYKSIDRLMRGISAEYNITPTKLHNQFKEKHNLIPDDWVKQQKEEVDTSNWKDDYKPIEIETEDIIKPEPLKPSEPVTDVEKLGESIEELETLAKIRDNVDVEVDNSTNMMKSIEILDKLAPDEEIDIDGKDSEVNRLRREIDQLRKMVYESVRHTSTIGGGGAGFIKDLDDVNIAGLQNGYILSYNSTTQKWDVIENQSTGGIANGIRVLTTTERDALTPSAGAIIYNSTTDVVQIYTGTAWVGVAPDEDAVIDGSVTIT